jgi:IclR family transcriptional regulator, acetate operon repressor
MPVQFDKFYFVSYNRFTYCNVVSKFDFMLKMQINEPYPGTQAVLRAISLLKSFTDEHPQLGLAELARTVGLNKTTTYRLLTALESQGLIARNPANETYRLGPEVIALGGRALRASDLRSISRAELEALARTTSETATLEILIGAEVLVLDEVSGTHLVGATQYIGARWPAHATSTGKALLAFSPEAEREAALPHPLPQVTTQTIAAPEALDQELTQIREQGYATAIEELELGFSAIGAPVYNHDGQVVAAIGINGPSARLTPERLRDIAPLVIDAVERVSVQLGFKPETLNVEHPN